MPTGSEIEMKAVPAAAKVIAVGPSCTVVLVSGPDRAELTSALATGAPVCQALGLALKVLNTDESFTREMATRFPSVSWLTVASGATDGERRRIGFMAAGTDIVLFARPREMSDPAWVAGLRARFEPGPRSSAEPSPEWAVLLAERGVPGALGDI